MRLSFGLGLLLVILATPAWGKGVGQRAPGLVNVVDGRGGRVSLSDFSDQLVVLTFGASWCAPCEKELPALEKLARSYSGKDVVFLAVNVDSSKAKGKKFMAKAGLKRVRALYDHARATVEAFDPPTMPSIYIIKNNIVRWIHAGYRSGDERKVKSNIDALRR